MSSRYHTNRAIEYAKNVVSGDIVAGEYIRLACAKFLRELDDDQFDWEFVPAYAEPVCRFLEQTPHIKGKLATERKTLTLELWQEWVICELYGWRSRDDHRVRRYEEALTLIGKKNGKSLLASGLGIYELKFGDEGAEVYSVATKSDQAKIVYSVAKKQIVKMPAVLREDIRLTVHEISHEDSIFKPLSSESKSMDGLNPSFVIVDEAAAIKDRNVVESVESGITGSRFTACMFYITTAQFTSSTIFFEKREHSIKVLKGEIEDDRVFAALYELDESDDPLADESCWIKANPNLGISVGVDYLHRKVRSALAKPSARNGVLVKHFNKWVGSDSSWLPGDAWKECATGIRTLFKKIAGRPCWFGLDLAQTRDLTAAARLWHVSRGRFAADFRFWIPQSRWEAIKEIEHLRPIYEAAIASDILVVTSGQTTDFGAVKEYVDETCEEEDVKKIGIDPAQAVDLVNQMEADGREVLIVRQRVSHMSGPAKEIEGAVLDGRILHDGNPFVTWQLENCCVRKYDSGDIYVHRSRTDEERKVDGIIALIIARACADVSETPESDSVAFGYVRIPGPGQENRVLA